MLRFSFVDNSIDGVSVQKIYYDKAETIIYLIAWKICKVSCVGVGKGDGHFSSFIETGLDVVVVNVFLFFVLYQNEHSKLIKKMIKFHYLVKSSF